MKNTKVSVIIPTFNSGKYLKMCLKSINQQNYKNIEVIIVDNLSNDDTVNIAKSFGSRIFVKRLNRSQARNYGAGIALGDYLLFIDSDMKLDANVVKDCLEKINKKSCSGVIIPEHSIGKGFWADCKALEKKLYLKDVYTEAARFFRKNDFDLIEGYDVNLEAGEDWDLNMRIKNLGNIMRTDYFIDHYEGVNSLSKNLINKFYYGKKIKPFLVKHRADARKKLFYKKSLINFSLLIKDPVHYFGLIIMKLLEMLFFATGMLFNSIKH